MPADSGIAYDVVAVTNTPKEAWRVILERKDGALACVVTFEGPEAKQCAEEYAQLMVLMRDEG